MKQESERFSLKAYSSPEHPGMNWVVTGPASGTRRRWRRLFGTSEEAENFLRLKQGSEEKIESAAIPMPPAASAPKVPIVGVGERPQKHRGRKTRVRGFHLPNAGLALGLLVILGLAFFIDRMVRAKLRVPQPNVLVSENFEANPVLTGWTASAQEADWTTSQHHSGVRSILSTGGEWTSPLIAVRSSGWYRVSFQSRADRPPDQEDRHGRCVASFLDLAGQEICAVTFHGVSRSREWQPNEFYVQSPRVAEAAATQSGARMAIRFPGEARQSFYFDDVIVERATDPMGGTEVVSRAQRSHSRPSNASELMAAAAEFATDPGEWAIVGDTFRSGSIFRLQGMVLEHGEAFGAPEKTWPQLSYHFREPLDLSDGEINVYWAIRVDPRKDPELGKLHTFLNFTDPPPGPHAEAARIAVNLRSNQFSEIYVDPGWEMENLVHSRLEGKGESFPDAQTLERFCLRVRSLGGDAVLAETMWWNRTTRVWEGFAPVGKPNGEPVVLQLSAKKQLLGNTSFRSLQFQCVSDAPRLDTVLVTRRLARPVPTGHSPEPDAAPNPPEDK